MTAYLHHPDLLRPHAQHDIQHEPGPLRPCDLHLRHARPPINVCSPVDVKVCHKVLQPERYLRGTSVE
jgi:hypothetical protein